MSEENEIKILGKIIYTRTDRIRSQQIRESCGINLLMSGWKEEEENGTSM